MTAAVSLPRAWFACGDCADKIIAGGGRRDENVKEVSYGRLCEVHPRHLPDMHATSAVELGTWTAPIGAAPDELAELPELEELPTAIGPLTRIAADLLVAWSAGNAGNVDPVIIAAAVLHARELLRLTKGR